MKRKRSRGNKPKAEHRIQLPAVIPQPQAHAEREVNPLPPEVKRRIVIELASFSNTTEVCDMLFEEYGITMYLQDINRYDATKHYCVLGEALKALFHETRKAYVEGVADLHIANQAFRLRRLMAMAMKAEKAGALSLAATLYKQAAEDHGGSYTNEKKLSGQVDHRHRMTAEKAREVVASFLGEQKADKAEATKH